MKNTPNDQNENTGSALVVEDASPVITAMEKASIDVQITTAKAYPRELSRVKGKMLSFATLDEETAASCFYTLPARKGGDKPIQGPSARLAEIAVASYGHIRAGSRVISNDGKTITAQAFCHDLENNVHVALETKRRITTRTGQTFSEDMQVVVGNAACSIAFRNAVFKVVPMALVKPVFEAAKRVAIGDVKTLAARRSAAVDYFLKMGVHKDRIFAVLGVTSVEDIQLQHLEILTGLRTAIADGDTTVEEAFPAPATPERPLFRKIVLTPTADQPSAQPAPVEPAKEEVPS
jgi:hypothetical protein